jgi:hypothetical protein
MIFVSRRWNVMEGSFEAIFDVRRVDEGLEYRGGFSVCVSQESAVLNYRKVALESEEAMTPERDNCSAKR